MGTFSLPGADHLRDSQPLTELLKKQAGSGKLTSAICASPAVVLQPLGILDGLRATCYPVERFTGGYTLAFRNHTYFAFLEISDFKGDRCEGRYGI